MNGENAKDELINALTMMLKEKGIEDAKYDLYIIMNDYDIEKVSTDITVYQGDVNDQILKRYIVSKTIQGCTNRTIKLYRDEILKFSSFINKTFTEVTSDDVKFYLAVKKTKDKVSKTTMGNIWRCLSAFYGWMTKEDIVSKNIMLKVEPVKKEKKKKKAFTEEDIEKIRDGCRNARDRCMIEVMLSTWCRVTELSYMKISDIKEDGSMTVFGKGEKERTVYINARAKYQIEKYIETRTDNNDWLFVSLDKHHDRLYASGLEIATRNIGKTGATFALRAGMPIETVSQILGHENIETTQIYLDIDETKVHEQHERYSR